MGQIESTVQNETSVFSKEKEEKENHGGNSNGFETESGSENKEMLHCVKNRIDMLIEGCLLSKEPNDLWVPDNRLKKSSSDVIAKATETPASENPKDADNGADISDDSEKKREQISNADADVSKTDKELSDDKTNDVKEGKEKSSIVEQDEKISETITLEEKPSDKEIRKEIEIKVEDSKNVKLDETADTKQGRKEKIKMSDIISEMKKNDSTTDSHKKKLTTFQTFIDQVLDNSLQHVNATMKVEKTTNILELCSRSMNPAEKQTKMNENSVKKECTVKTESISESRSIANNSGNIPHTDKSPTQKSDKEKLIKSEPTRISLKDHIERFLELSFQEKKPSDDEKQSVSKQTDQNRETNLAGKSGNSENFNAQGLVNNMINQGLQINKLLSPSPGKGKEAQKSPSIRSETVESSRREFHQMPWPYEERQSVQNPKFLETERMNSSRQYTVGSKYNSGLQRSPNGSSTGFIEMEQQRSYLVRPKVEYPDYKGRMFSDRPEVVREEHILSQERYPGYPVNKFQKPVPHLVTTHPADTALHSAMMYASQFSPRHPLITNSDTQNEHIGMLQESLSNRGHKQPVHLRDCKCAMCITLSDPRYQAGDHKSPEYQSKMTLSPSGFPQFSPSHAVHPAYLSFQRLQNPQDQPPAMMRPSHSAVPPGCLGYQMPKLLPHHPPITSPKEYSQLQLNMPPNVQASKPIHPAHRLSTEDSLSADMYTAYRQSRLDHNGAYQKRPKEHEIARCPAASPRRPSSNSRDEYGKEAHDILLSPEPRVSGVDWPRRRDCPSNSSSVSVGETPLDLSCKKADTEKSRRQSFGNFRASPDGYQLNPHRPRTHSLAEESHIAAENGRIVAHRGSSSQQSVGNFQRSGNMPFNTFIKHLESSVDKYCQELKTSPPPGHPITSPNPVSSKSGSPNEMSSVHGYQGQSSPNSGPQGSTSGFRALSPRAPYAGGITLGQPIMGPEARSHMDSRQSPNQTVNPASSQQTSSVMQPQPVSSAGAVSFASLEHAKRNNISKHEPIQNIIGSHDPNDILYLICKLCAQTYGSPYGFRKHFRNQHGFEPRAEDTVVQTISATKTALNGPNIVVSKGQGMDDNIENGSTYSNGINISRELSQDIEANTRLINESPSLMKSNSSSCQDSGSVGSEEDQEGERAKAVQDDSKETKCLECPECGKTFQLNDFGSYKRHCRQHGQVKMNSSLACSKCHLSFADQQLLKEHYNVHVKEPQIQNKNNDKPVSKSEMPSNVYSCVPCEKTFDNMSAYQDHVKVNHNKNDGPPKLSPQINVINENTENSVTSKEDGVESKWPDISLSVIPSHNIIKQAAESMTATACPDSSSWSDNDNNKNVPCSSRDKIEDDSASVGSNSNLNVGEKVKDDNEKVQRVDYLSQKSVDSSQDNTDERGSEDGCEFQYKHKKFHNHRKRAFSSCSQSSDNSVPVTKQSKLSPPVLSRSDTPVTSCAVLITNESADSTCSVDSKGTDSPGVKDCPLAPSPVDDLKTSPLDGSLKQEARHHLPFVWDRVTRSQVGRKTK